MRMTKEEKKTVVLAMEILARNINDEDIFMGWLMCGVADGDIDYQSAIEKLSEISEEMVDDYYVEEDNYKDLCDCFLRRMALAKKSGGLCTY